MKTVSRAMVVAVAVAALAIGPWAMARTQSARHAAGKKAALCEVCAKPIVAKTEVVAENAGVTHHYRCINCALLAARDRLKGDITLHTHSALTGTPVSWTRRAGKWQVKPASASVLDLPETTSDCSKIHLVFASQAEYQSYAKQHRDVAGHKLLAAAAANRIVEAGRPPLPKQATCPVTGEKIHPTAKTDWTMYKGKVYYFCCGDCKPLFEKNPAGYISGKLTKSDKSGACAAKGGSCASGSGKAGMPRTPVRRRTSKGRRA